MFPEHRTTTQLEKLLQDSELFGVDVRYNPVRDVLLELAKKVESLPSTLQNVPPPVVVNDNDQEIKELTRQFNQLKQINKEQYSEFNGEIRELKQYFSYQLKDVRDKYDKKLISLSNLELKSNTQPTEIIPNDDKYENLANQLENLSLRFEKFVNSVNGISTSPIHYGHQNREIQSKEIIEEQKTPINENLELDLSKVANETNTDASFIITEKANSQPSTPTTKIPHYIQKEIFKDPRIDDLLLQIKLIHNETKSQNEKINKVVGIANNMIKDVETYRQEMESRNEEFERIYDKMVEMNMGIDQRFSTVNAELDKKFQPIIEEQSQIKQSFQNQIEKEKKVDEIKQKLESIKSEIFENLTLIETNSKSQFHFVEREIEEMKKQITTLGNSIKDIPEPIIIEKTIEPKQEEELNTKTNEEKQSNTIEEKQSNTIEENQSNTIEENQSNAIKENQNNQQVGNQPSNSIQRNIVTNNQKDYLRKIRQYSIIDISPKEKLHSPKLNIQEAENKPEVQPKLEKVEKVENDNESKSLKTIEQNKINDQSIPKESVNIHTEPYEIPITKFDVSTPNGSVPNAISTFHICDIEKMKHTLSLHITPLISFVQSSNFQHLSNDELNPKEQNENSFIQKRLIKNEAIEEKPNSVSSPVINVEKHTVEDVVQPTVSIKSREFSFERMLIINILNSDSSTDAFESLQAQINEAMKLASTPKKLPQVKEMKQQTQSENKPQVLLEKSQTINQNNNFIDVMKPIIESQQKQISLIENRVKQLEASQNEVHTKQSPKLQLQPLSPRIMKRKPMVLSPHQTVKKSPQKNISQKENEILSTPIKRELSLSDEQTIVSKPIEVDDQHKEEKEIVANENDKIESEAEIIQKSEEENILDSQKDSELEMIAFAEDTKKSVNADLIEKLDDDIKISKCEIAQRFNESELIEFRDRLIELERQFGFLSKQVSALSTPTVTQPVSSRVVKSSESNNRLDQECQPIDFIEKANENVEPLSQNPIENEENDIGISSRSATEILLNIDDIGDFSNKISEQSSVCDKESFPEQTVATKNEIESISKEQFNQYKSYCNVQFKSIKNDIQKLINEIQNMNTDDIIVNLNSGRSNASTILQSGKKVEVKEVNQNEPKADDGLKKRIDTKTKALDNQIKELRSEMYNLIQKSQQRSNKLIQKIDEQFSLKLQQVMQNQSNNQFTKSHKTKPKDNANELIKIQKEVDDIPIDSFHIDSHNTKPVNEKQNQSVGNPDLTIDWHVKQILNKENRNQDGFTNAQNELKQNQSQIPRIQIDVNQSYDTKNIEQNSTIVSDPVNYITTSPRYGDFLKEFYERPVPQAFREVSVTNIEPAKVVFQTMVLPYLIDVRKDLQSKIDKALELSRLSQEMMMNKVDKDFVNDFFRKIRIKIIELKNIIEEVKDSNMNKVTHEELQNLATDLYKSVAKEQTTMIGATSCKCLLCGAPKHGVNGMITDKNVIEALGDPQQARAANNPTMIFGSDKQCYRGRGNYGRTCIATKRETRKNKPL